MSSGVKIVFRKDNLVLAMKCGDDGWNLPSMQVFPGERAEDIARVLFTAVTGLKDADVEHIVLSADDEHGTASSFSSGWSGSPKCKASWVEVQEVLCGKWGLHAVDAFNRMGLMKRPRLSIAKLYSISKKALSRDSDGPGEAIDMALDEISFLIDAGKPWAVDALLRSLDTSRLHADVLAAMMVAIEEIPELPARDSFNLSAKRRIEQVDGIRTKIRFGNIADVRAAAAEKYKQKATEYGKDLREGKLSARFPGMKHIVEAEARVRARETETSAAERMKARVPPMAEWPEAYLKPVEERKDVLPVFDPYRPDALGVSLERPRSQRGFGPEPSETEGPSSVKDTVITCSKCASRQQGGKFCKECGTAIEQVKRCSDCHAKMEGGEKFCMNCGKQAHVSESP